MSEHINASASMRRKTRYIGCALVVSAALGGCTPKANDSATSPPAPQATQAPTTAIADQRPPNCADPRVSKMIADEILVKARAFTEGEHPSQQPGYDSFFRDAKISMDQITTDGYDAAAKRRACQGQLNFTKGDPKPQAMSASVVYTIQMTEGSSGEFLVRTDDHSPVTAPIVAGIARSFADSVRLGEIKIAQPNAAPVADGREQAKAKSEEADGSQHADPEPVLPGASSVSPKEGVQASAGPKPSFSCAGNLSPAERLICDTPTLADADAKLGRLYATALSRASDQAALKQQQRDWRRTRDVCGDVACMNEAYSKRSAELSR